MPMRVSPKMCDLDPLSPLSCLPLVLVLSRSFVSCLALLFFFVVVLLLLSRLL